MAAKNFPKIEQDGRRRSVRLPSTLSVKWMRRQGDLKIVAADIGLHGMFLRTEEEAMPGSLLQLVVMLPNRCNLTMYVTVRFVGATTNGRGMGVELFLMDEIERRAWGEHYRSELERHNLVAPMAATAG